jgi:hypothetical protein
MSEVAMTAPLAMGGRKVRGAWIVSPAFDLALLVWVPLLTLPIVAGIYFSLPLLVIGGGVTLAFAHYGSSLSFYFWRENHEYHRRRWLAFYAGPLILAAIYFLLLGFRIPYVIQFVLFFWNTFHVARQNCGILSMYRVGSGVTDVEQRNVANRAILAVSTFLALWNIGTHKEVTALFNMVSSDLSLAVRMISGVVAAVALVQLAVVLRRRVKNGSGIGAPELLFLLTSLAFFYPYLFITSSELATFAMLLPHYVQYMSIVWLLHRRKFGATSGGVPVALRWMSKRLSVLLPILFGAGFTFYLFHVASVTYGHLYLFESIYLLIALEHFYMDGLIWSFKQPHVRETIGKFLRPAAASV